MTHPPPYADLDDLFRAALHLAYAGEEAAPRGRRVREARGVTLTLADPASNVVTDPLRRLNYHFMAAEWLWISLGLDDVATIAGYNKQIAQFSDDGERFFGAYGPKVARDLPRVADLLRRDPDSRQAVVGIWDPAALSTATKDVPCTLHWQFFVRDARLEMHAAMRSNDAWLGLPYDVFNFTQVQRQLASRLGLPVGAYHHSVGSLHVYEEHWERAEALLRATQDPSRRRSTSPPPTGKTPVWVRSLLTQLPRGLSVDDARKLARLVEGFNWQEYAGILVHRFSKDPADLGPYFARLLEAR